MTRSMKDAALAMAKRGFNVFDLSPQTKHPAYKGWQTYATTKPEDIDRIWDDAHADFNVGILCGRDHEPLTVLDFDPDNVTFESELLWHSLPDTFTVRTPSGGEHKYFCTWTASISASRLAPGIDSRSGGKGYVAGPGSYSAKRRKYYEIIHDVPMAELPLEHQRVLNRHKDGRPYDDVDPDAPGGANDPTLPPPPVKRVREKMVPGELPEKNIRVSGERPSIEYTATVETVREALSHIPADCDRGDCTDGKWAEVMMSIKAQPDLSDDEKLALADQWSATAPERYNKAGDDGLSGYDSVAIQMSAIHVDGGIGPGTLYFISEWRKYEKRVGHPVSRAEYSPIYDAERPKRARAATEARVLTRIREFMS